MCRLVSRAAHQRNRPAPRFHAALRAHEAARKLLPRNAMRFRFVLLALACFACGRIAPEGTGASTAPGVAPGSSSGGGSSPRDGGERSGTDEDLTCRTADVAGRRGCVPGLALAGVPLSLHVDADGCLACGATLSCAVTVAGSAIELAMSAQICPPPGGPCPPVCLPQDATCALPPLAAGTYEVKVKGEAPRKFLPPRQLVVAADATATSCELPTTTTSSELDGSRFSTACHSDADCTLVATGDVCGCAALCPGTAVAKTALLDYAAELRSKTSACVPDPKLQCPACEPLPVSCKIEPNALVGTCVVAR